MLGAEDLRTNPLKRAREHISYSQADLAAAVGMTPNAVLKYEQGLYEKPSEKLLSFLASFGIDPNELTEWYYVWRHWKRINAKWTPVDRINFNAAMFGEVPKHPFTSYRHACGFDSVQSFCIEFCIHPATVARYETGDSATMPLSLKNALSEAGLTAGEIGIIQQYGAAYHENLTLAS